MTAVKSIARSLQARAAGRDARSAAMERLIEAARANGREGTVRAAQPATGLAAPVRRAMSERRPAGVPAQLTPAGESRRIVGSR